MSERLAGRTPRSHPSVGRLLGLVSLIVLVDTMFFAAVTPLLPDYVERIGLSKTGAGLLSAAYPVGVIVGSLPSGLLVVRLGARRTVLIGLLGLAGASVAFGQADDVILLDAARFVQGLSGACAWTGGLSWLVAGSPAERRGGLLGAAIGAGIGGALLGPVLGGLAALVGPPIAFGGVALVALGLAALAWVTPGIAVEERQPLRVLVRAAGDHAVRRAVWLVTLPALMFGTMSVLAPLRLDELGVSSFGVGAVYFVAAAMEALLSPLLGRLSDRIGRLPPLRVGLLTSAAATLVLPWASSSTRLAVAVVVAAMAFGTFWAPAFSLLADAAEARGLDHGYGFALMNLAWGPGQAIGAGAGGALGEATSDAVPFTALTVLCIVTFAAMQRSP